MAIGGSDIITITLDGLAVSGHRGMTILNLATESGINIPTLCSDPNLTPIGACRICIVEDERTGNILASCVTPIETGMVINTSSSAVLSHRKNIIELLLASHPNTCMVCDKGNRCQLRQIASDMGIGLSNLYKIPQIATISEINPFIERDLTKCILCAKCIRACQEMVVEGAIDYFGRGFTAKPATFNDLPLESSECTFCGTCVSLCPTGALSEKEKIYRSSTGKTAEIICPFCGCGCRLSAEIKESKIVRTTPSKQNTVNKGTACILGSYGCDFVNSSNRLTKPLIKVNDQFKETTWDIALELVANELQSILDTYGPDKIAFIGSPRCSNEDNYILQKFARCVVGTHNIDFVHQQSNYLLYFNIVNNLRIPLVNKRIEDIDKADVIIAIGQSPQICAPVVSYAIKRAVKFKKANLILIDQQESKLTNFSSKHLCPKSETVTILLNGIAKYIVENNLIDKESINRKTTNFHELQDFLSKITTNLIETMTGISTDDISQVAETLVKAKYPLIIFGPNLNDSENILKNILNLLVLTDNTHNNKGGLIILCEENNHIGACDMGALPDYLPGHVSVPEEQLRARFEKYWGIELPAKSGLNTAQIIKIASQNGIKALYIMGEDLISDFGNTDEIKQALSSIKFIVVQDMFLTETAKYANVIFPASSFIEKDGTYTNLEGRIQKSQKIISPVGESMPDWKIIKSISEKMKCKLTFSSFENIMREIETLIPFYQRYTDLNKPKCLDIDTLQSRADYLAKQFIGMPIFYVEEHLSEQKLKDNAPQNSVKAFAKEQIKFPVRTSMAPRLSKLNAHKDYAQPINI